MKTTPGLIRRAVTILATMWLFGVAGCHRQATQGADADDGPRAGAPVSQADKDEKDRDEALRLTPTDQTKLGIVVSSLESASFLPEATGYAQVVGRDTLAQALSEVEVARIRSTQSHAALERSSKLQGTAGADAVPEHEAAVRQDAEDRAAVLLAQAKMSSLLGQPAARALGADHALIDSIAAGRRKLVRATLPLGALRSERPPALRVARLDAAPGDGGWRASHVWPGPVDPAVPGRAFLVLVDAPALAEGERLIAYASTPDSPGDEVPLQGALVPTSALVLTGDDAWVYVETKPGGFSREHLDTTRPLPTGYFVVGKLAPGTRVITAGAGMLLSRELDVSPDD